MKKRGMGTDALLLTISKIVTLMITMVSSMLLSRFRTLGEYGTYSQVILVITIAISIFTFGMPNSINYFLARAENQNESRRFLSTYYVFNTIVCIIMGVALVAGTPLAVIYFKNEMIYSFAYVFALLPWALVISASVTNVLIVYNKTPYMIIYTVTHSVLTLSVILVVKIFHLNFYEYMLGYVAVQCFFAAIVYIIVWRLAHGLSVKISRSVLKSIIKYSIPIGIASIMGTLLIEMDKLMIGGFFDTENLAIYTNASKEMPVSIIASSISAVLIPNIVRLLKADRKDDAINLWKQSVNLSFGIISFISFALVAFAPQVITVLYSEKYVPGTGVFRIYSLVLLFRATYFGMMLSSMNKTRYIMLSSAFAFLPNIVLNYALYKLIGFEGPAYATLICIAATQAYQLYYSAKALGTKFSNIYPWLDTLKSTMINAVPCVAIIIFYKIFNIGTSNKDIIISIAVGIAWAIIYFAARKKVLLKEWKALNHAEI